MKKYSRKWFEENIDRFDGAYFEENDCISGIPVKKTPFEYEKKIEKYLNDGTVNLEVVAWKMGCLDKFFGKGNDVHEDMPNGYGSFLEIESLKSYIDGISNIKISNELMAGKANIDEIYTPLKKQYEVFAQESPQYFGPVNIINLIYFKTKTAIPIFDRFAYRAVKAVHYGIHPSRVFAGMSLEKNNSKAVVNLLLEYMRLLQGLFGKYSIDRKIDRALWVYGHATEKFEGEL